MGNPRVAALYLNRAGCWAGSCNGRYHVPGATQPPYARGGRVAWGNHGRHFDHAAVV